MDRGFQLHYYSSEGGEIRAFIYYRVVVAIDDRDPHLKFSQLNGRDRREMGRKFHFIGAIPNGNAFLINLLIKRSIAVAPLPPRQQINRQLTSIDRGLYTYLFMCIAEA